MEHLATPGLKKYGLLSRVRRLHANKPRPETTDWYWLWRCDCGGERVAKLKKVAAGRVVACRGCPLRPPASEKRARVVRCATCGGDFEGRGRAKYCSPRCRPKPPRPEPKARPSEVRNCRHCGREFTVKAGGRGAGPKRCSTNCTPTRPRRRQQTVACLLCGAEFVRAVVRGRPKKYCGRGCTSRAQIERQTASKTCGCGAPIKSVGGKRCRPCSQKLVRRGFNAVDPGLVRRCAECGTAFSPASGNQKYCSPGCENRNHCRYRQHKRRSVQKAGDRFGLMDLFLRDKGLCGVCGEAVNVAILWPDPLSPSVDHVVPLSRGGPHTFANCQLAHLGCNSRKHNRQESLV